MVEANWGAPPAYGGEQAQQVGISYHLAEDPAAEMPEASAAQATMRGGALNVIGAVLSLALLVGLGLWGYRLAVRDVSGVPVVRALAGPMRIQPEDPGGEEVAYQGYAVNAVQAEGSAADPADTLALAPRDAGLAPDDMTSPAPEAVAAAASSAQEASDLAVLAEQISDSAMPLSDVTQTSADVTQAVQHAADRAVTRAVAVVQTLPADLPGLARSPRPPLRPQGLVSRVSAPADPASSSSATMASTEPATREIAARDIAAGTLLVQLGAFDSPQTARAEWARLAGRFEDFFGDKSMVIMQAKAGGKRFWRLRAAGFEDIANARRFCSVLKAQRAACIPVVTR